MADGMRVIVVSNRFEKFAVELGLRAEELVADTANGIEADMKSRTSERIAKTVIARRRNGGKTATITAGDKQKAIHAGFEEYGTVFDPGHPFATPAANAARPTFDRKAAELLKAGL